MWLLHNQTFFEKIFFFFFFTSIFEMNHPHVSSRTLTSSKYSCNKPNSVRCEPISEIVLYNVSWTSYACALLVEAHCCLLLLIWNNGLDVKDNHLRGISQTCAEYNPEDHFALVKLFAKNSEIRFSPDINRFESSEFIATGPYK